MTAQIDTLLDLFVDAICDRLHEKCQFFDETGKPANEKVLEQIRQALMEEPK